MSENEMASDVLNQGTVNAKNEFRIDPKDLELHMEKRYNFESTKVGEKWKYRTSPTTSRLSQKSKQNFQSCQITTNTINKSWTETIYFQTIWLSIVFANHSGSDNDILSIMELTWKHTDWIWSSHVCNTCRDSKCTVESIWSMCPCMRSSLIILLAILSAFSSEKKVRMFIDYKTIY